MMGWLRALWDLITAEPAKSIPTIAAIISIILGIVTLMTLIARRRSGARKPTKQVPLSHAEATTSWSDNLVARRLDPVTLRRGLAVHDGTRVVVIVGNVCQFRLDAGKNPAEKVKDLMQRHAVSERALVLQYRTSTMYVSLNITDLQVSGNLTDVEAMLQVQVRVLEADAPKLLSLDLDCDGLVRLMDVARILAGSICPWLSSRIQGIEFEKLAGLSGHLQDEVKPILEQLAASYGLLIEKVRDLSFRSVQFEARQRQLGQSFQAWVGSQKDRPGTMPDPVIGSDPQQFLQDQERLNELKRIFREQYRKDYADQASFEADLRAIDDLKNHEEFLRQLRSLREVQEQMRLLYDAMPQLHWFSRQEIEFLEAEKRTDALRREVSARLDSLRENVRPHRLEFNLAPKGYGARTIAPQPARSHRKLHGGEDIIFSARSPVAGYLSVFNLGTTGETVLIYPNKFQTVGKITAGVPLEIPDKSDYEFDKVKGTPFGVEIIRAFVTPEPVSSYIPVNIPPGEYYAVWQGRGAVEVFNRLAGRLRELPGSSWSMGETSFEVVAD